MATRRTAAASWSAVNALAKKAKKHIYSDTQLRAIEKSLEMIGVDVSATPECETEVWERTSEDAPDEELIAPTITWSYLIDREGNGRDDPLAHGTVCERLLAEIWVFTRILELPLPTPKQRAASLTADIEKLEAAYDALGDVFIGPFLPEDPRLTEAELRVCTTSHHVARLALEEQIAYQRWLRDALVGHSRSSGNAKKKHVQFWQLVTLIWQRLRATKPRRHKHLQEFLRACSAPLYPKATTDKALTAFVERNFPQTS
jgi:hypothetical protein